MLFSGRVTNVGVCSSPILMLDVAEVLVCASICLDFLKMLCTFS